jgi:hypothetical protein
MNSCAPPQALCYRPLPRAGLDHSRLHPHLQRKLPQSLANIGKQPDRAMLTITLQALLC